MRPCCSHVEAIFHPKAEQARGGPSGCQIERDSSASGEAAGMRASHWSSWTRLSAAQPPCKGAAITSCRSTCGGKTTHPIPIWLAYSGVMPRGHLLLDNRNHSARVSGICAAFWSSPGGLLRAEVNAVLGRGRPRYGGASSTLRMIFVDASDFRRARIFRCAVRCLLSGGCAKLGGGIGGVRYVKNAVSRARINSARTFARVLPWSTESANAVAEENALPTKTTDIIRRFISCSFKDR